MAKDPAVLWYFGDWAGGTMTMTRHQKGCYIDLLCAQFNNGKLSLDEIKTVLGGDYGQSWPTLSKKFEKDESGLFFNRRLQEEKEKRVKYSESRRANRKDHMNKHMNNHMSPHMENENINRNESIDKSKEFNALDYFNAQFSKYPNKIRDGFARSLYFQIVVSESIAKRVLTAQERYLAHLGAQSWKESMEFTRFLNEWTQWENYIEPPKEKKYASASDRLIAKIAGK